MSKVLKLAFAFLREHPTRLALTSIATIAATCMVIWVAAGYDALLKTFDQYANLALGRYELSIAPIGTAEEKFVAQDVLDALRADPAVLAADPMWLQRATIRSANLDAKQAAANEESAKSGDGKKSDKKGESRLALGEGPGSGPPGPRRSEFHLLATQSTEPPFDVEGEWLNVNSDDLTAALRKDVAERLGVKLGDEVFVIHNETRTPLRVVGILNAPAMMGANAYLVPQILAPSVGEVFVSNVTAAKLFGQSPPISFVAIAMKPEADITKFRFGWAPKLSRYEVPVQFQEAYEIEEALDESAAADNVQMQSYATTGVAMLVALLVIFCTLNMGVSERTRQFAVLRAVVLTRGQVCLLIFAEGLLLASIGFFGGLAISWVLLMLIERSSRLLHHGAQLGTQSLVLAAAATYLGALLASCIPAYRATRVRPIDAMAPRSQSSGSSVLPIPVILLGVVLIAINPLLTFVFPPKFESQVMVSLAVGFITMGIGFVLIAPAVVAWVDRFLGPILARLLGIDPKLLASQITTHLWRSVGAAISMALGIGLFIGVQVWGFTMLGAFVPGDWTPDAIIAFRPTGLPLEHVAEISKIPGINAQQSLPIVVEQPRLLHDITGSADRASVTRQDNIVIIGIDPAKGFGGEHPLFDLEWVAGTPETVIPQMQAGRACIVPDHFLSETGLKIGDEFELVPPEDDDHPVRYTIAGAVRLPGWHWQTKLTGFRSRTHRAAAMVFANYEPVAKDFALPAATHVWFNYDSPDADPDQIAKAAQGIFAQALGRDVVVGNNPDGGPSLRVMPVADIRKVMMGNARRWIWGISQLPLIATVIAGFGVLNVILASVRARCWEMGVLRAIGITRGTIVRAIFAEGIMIGLVACLLSLGFGIMAGWCGCGMAQYISFFGGLHPDLVVPWLAVAAGLVIVLLLASLTAAWPAFSIGRTRPLALLQQGRNTF